MTRFNPFSLNIRGKVTVYDRAAVMGIVNVTPDSFYSESRATDADTLRRRVETVIAEGADIVDVGAYSSRPGAVYVDDAEELRRLEAGIKAVREVSVDIPVSVDTFKSRVARTAIDTLGADIINDISGGTLDEKMVEVVADTHAPYIMMHMRGTPADMQLHTDYRHVTTDVIAWFSRQLALFSMAGAGDIIVDPGFGFSKTADQNFQLLSELEQFGILGRPLLAGMSRKSMIYNTLGVTAEQSLNGTTTVNTIALMKGAQILRVHDVAAAREAVTLMSRISL